MKHPIHRKARSSYERIWAVVRRIPRGRVATYGQVAALAGLPGHARLAGYALYAAPEGALPWHRVVNAEGRLSLARKNPSGGLTQRLRLLREGVLFDARGRVDLDRHRWDPRPGRRKGRR
jgi:methylated-DNA-protein-cysteine methyltransferase-like protein